ncbi:hypothetical protein FWK35_00023659, partial [Aphis craccivora]
GIVVPISQLRLLAALFFHLFHATYVLIPVSFHPVHFQLNHLEKHYCCVHVHSSVLVLTEVVVYAQSAHGDHLLVEEKTKLFEAGQLFQRELVFYDILLLIEPH